MREKNYSISLVRLISMLLIISCHTCEWIGEELSNDNRLAIFGNYCAVGVQIFLIISGYLYGSREELFEENSRVGFLITNFKKILKDYYIYVIFVVFPIYSFLDPDSINLSSIFGVLTCSGVMGGVHHLWFIPYILLAYILTPFLYDLKKYFLNNKNSLARLSLLLSGLIVITEVIGHAFGSYFISAWVNCYIVGFYLPQIVKKLSEKDKRILIAAMLIGACMLNYMKLTVRYELLPLYTKGIKNTLCTYFINYSRDLFALTIFCTVLYITRTIRTSGKIQKLLDLSDEYSYDIYLVHMIYIKGALSVLDLTNYMVLNVLIMLMLTVVSAMILKFVVSHLKFGSA